MGNPAVHSDVLVVVFILSMVLLLFMLAKWHIQQPGYGFSSLFCLNRAVIHESALSSLTCPIELRSNPVSPLPRKLVSIVV